MKNDITCVILAGGLARRMGNIDKAMVELAGQPLLEQVLQRMASQTPSMIINANGDPKRFSRWELPVVADTVSDFPGPLAGILAAMEWTRTNRPESNWIVSVPVDTPFIPRDLIERFSQTITDNKAELSCAKSDGRTHPVVGMWPVALADDLRTALTVDNIRKVDLWTGRFNLVHSEFETNPIDPFFNINRPEDIERAEQVLQRKN